MTPAALRACPQRQAFFCSSDVERRARVRTVLPRWIGCIATMLSPPCLRPSASIAVRGVMLNRTPVRRGVGRFRGESRGTQTVHLRACNLDVGDPIALAPVQARAHGLAFERDR